MNRHGRNNCPERFHLYLRGAFLAALLGLVACGEPSANPKLAEGQRLPEVVLTDLKGGTKSLSAYRGKLVVLNIWATWCPPCREEMPSLDGLSKSLDPRRTVVIGLSVDNDINLVREFLLQHQVGFENYFDGDMRIARDILGVTGFPETLLVGPDGKLIRRIIGKRNWQSGETTKLLDQARRESAS